MQKVYNLLRTLKGYFLKKNFKFSTLNGLKSRITKKHTPFIEVKRSYKKPVEEF